MRTVVVLAEAAEDIEHVTGAGVGGISGHGQAAFKPNAEVGIPAGSGTDVPPVEFHIPLEK